MRKIMIIFCIAVILSCAGNITAEQNTNTDDDPVLNEEIKVQEDTGINETEPVSAENTEYAISEEKYQLALSYINRIIDEINKAIAEKDFDTWKTYLSGAYIDAYDSPEDLEPYSDMFRQKGYETRLVNLKDFFNYIVVASRKNLEISHLEFLDATHLKVMTVYKQETAVFYYMELINDEWKISVW